MSVRLHLRWTAPAVLLVLSFARPSTAGDATLEIMGQRVAPGAVARLEVVLTESFGGVRIASPVQVVNGHAPGPRLCLTGAIHGDELNGVEVVRRVMAALDPAALRGAVVGLPIVNVPAFRNGSRYLPDRRDLNRAFPGRARGSLAARMAHALFDGVLRHCSVLIDVHTGSAGRVNLPQVRADTRIPAVQRLALSLGGLPVVHKKAVPGSLRGAATQAGIAAVTLEVGEAHRIDRHGIDAAVAAIGSAKRAAGLVAGAADAAGEVFVASHWLRASEGGVFYARVKLADEVSAGQVVGEIVDPVSSERVDVVAVRAGRVIGLAVEQMAMPGNALVHVAVRAE